MSHARKSLVLVAAALALSACGAKSVSTSSPDYAYFPAETAYGGPLGRLELLKQSFAVDFDKIRICVETGKQTVGDDNLLLEVKLAYANWLNAAGGYTEDDWDRYEFVEAKKCHQSDKSFGGFVVLEDLSNGDPGENPALNFQPEHLTCTVTGQQAGCQSAGITLGWGGPGVLQYWYSGGDQNKWVKLANYNPSTTRLSPYVSWLPLDEDIRRNTKANLTDGQKKALIAEYQKLVGTATPSLADLAAFGKDLATNNLVTADDPVFPKLMQQFADANGASLDQDYKGERGVFSTILHEVGHQYGMDHAHHPGQDSLTGQSDTTHKNDAGQWVTDISAMAYGLPYMYLTADDIAGVQADKTSILNFLATKH